jgi:transcriptional regulator with XRE-family HTH domain
VKEARDQSPSLKGHKLSVEFQTPMPHPLMREISVWPKVVSIRGESLLELRALLGMSRDDFCRLLNISVRTLAAVEHCENQGNKLCRPYAELARLILAVSGIVPIESLRSWFTLPVARCGGMKPVDIIQRGEIDVLWELVFRARNLQEQHQQEEVA